MLTPEAIAELKALAAKATAGPWTYDEMGGYVWGKIDGAEMIADSGSHECAEDPTRVTDIRGYGAGLPQEANAALIVALRNSLDDLLAAAEANAVMKGALEEYRNSPNWQQSDPHRLDLNLFKHNDFDNGFELAYHALAKVAAMKEQA